MTTPYFEKGHIFKHPYKDAGYKLNKDVFAGEDIQADHFAPFGDAEIPVTGAEIPDWLNIQLQKIEA